MLMPWIMRDCGNILESCNLTVSGTTHLDGGLLDHVYLLKSFIDGKK